MLVLWCTRATPEMSRFLRKKQITFHFLFCTCITEFIFQSLAYLNTFANSRLDLKTAHQLCSSYPLGKEGLCQKFESFEFIKQKVQLFWVCSVLKVSIRWLTCFSKSIICWEIEKERISHFTLKYIDLFSWGKSNFVQTGIFLNESILKMYTEYDSNILFI